MPCKCYSRNKKVVASREQYMCTDDTARLNCCRMLRRWVFNLPFNFLTNSWFSSDVKKTKIKNFKLLLNIIKLKSFLNKYLLVCLQVSRPLCCEIHARKYRFALCFRVLSNQYVERSAYAGLVTNSRDLKIRDATASRTRWRINGLTRTPSFAWEK